MKDNFKYVFKGKEVSKEQFEILTKDAFKWFSDNSINAVDFDSVSNFFSGDYKSNREINDHFKGILGDYENIESPLYNEQIILLRNLAKEPKEKIYPNLGNYLNKEQKVIEDLDKKEFYIAPPSKENLDKMCDSFEQRVKNDSDKCGIIGKKEKTTAYKETEGKLFYELDWGFITQMAERMASNKKESKYDLWNWKKPMTPKGIEDLKQATLRHLLAVLDGVYEDDNREFGHIEAISDNMMMINYQLKNNLK